MSEEEVVICNGCGSIIIEGGGTDEEGRRICNFCVTEQNRFPA